MRDLLLVVILAATVVGCAHAGQNPLVPVAPGGEEERGLPSPHLTGLAVRPDAPYRLLGEYTFFISAERDRVDIVPRRDMHLHLNALKFLEDYCKNCLQITSILNNGDGTIDLTVRITHPFPGLPQYTGFDVKGIIMFQGSHVFYRPDISPYKYPLIPQEYRASWRLLGDPELLNADGYSFRWSPWYDSGLPQPIFNYWPGKYSKGTPTANINGHLNFYSNEERHMFESDASVSRTYHIWLPPGPIVAGYAVEACWEPPIKTPVTNPAEDFPISANQPEAYHFHCVINDGEPITLDKPCCWEPESVHKARAEMDFWYLMPDFSGYFWVGAWCPEFETCAPGCATLECDGPPNWRCMIPYEYVFELDGHYQFVAFLFYTWGPYPLPYIAVDLFEVVIDKS